MVYSPWSTYRPGSMKSTTSIDEPERSCDGKTTKLLGLRERLLASLGDLEFAREWLKSPSLYLGHLTPLEMLRAGRPDRVEANLEAFDAGVAL